MKKTSNYSSSQRKGIELMLSKKEGPSTSRFSLRSGFNLFYEKNNKA
jgi:hypothetical protein